MHCVVKATAWGEHVRWLTGPRLAGHRTFATREFAESFDSEATAKAAILAMMTEEDCRGIVFSVEAADLTPSAPSNQSIDTQ
jgi:hypothetical protein